MNRGFHSQPKHCRAGKKTVAGHFSAELSTALNRMALDENASVQALLGEAIDLLMRERGNIRWESVKVFHMK